MEAIIARRRRLAIIVPDDGAELTSNAVLGGRPAYRVALHRGRQADAEAFVESFNGPLREECLNEYVFATLCDARWIVEAWRINTTR